MSQPFIVLLNIPGSLKDYISAVYTELIFVTSPPSRTANVWLVREQNFIIFPFWLLSPHLVNAADGEGERKDEAGNQAADVGDIGNSGGGKTKIQRKRKHYQHLLKGKLAHFAPAEEDDEQHRAHDRKDRPRGTDKDNMLFVAGVPVIGRDVAGQTSDEIDAQKTPGPQNRLKVRAENKEKKHVIDKMGHSGVQEHGRKEPPELPLGDEVGGGRSPGKENVRIQRASRRYFHQEENKYICYDKRRRCQRSPYPLSSHV